MSYPDTPKHLDIVTQIKALANYNATMVNALMKLLLPLSEYDLRKIHNVTFS